MEKDDKSVLLKKAKQALVWSFLFNRPVSAKYHCMMVKLECCSEKFLKYYCKNNSLNEEAQVLLVEQYAQSKPELIAYYIRHHLGQVADAMQIKIVENKNSRLLRTISEQIAGYIWHFEFDEPAVLALIGLNDAAYFCEALNYGLFPQKFSKQAITAVIETQNPKLFNHYLQYVRKNDVEFWNLHQKMLYEQGNNAMIDCFLKYMKFDANIQCDIIATENTALFAKLIKKTMLTDSIERFLAKSGSKKMLAQYIQQWPLRPEAQIALVKREFKDILKLHFLKHSISEQALLYVLGLSYFKEYLGIKS